VCDDESINQCGRLNKAWKIHVLPVVVGEKVGTGTDFFYFMTCRVVKNKLTL